MAELIVKIGATSKKFQDELKRLEKQTKDFSGSLESAAKVSGVAFIGLSGIIAATAKTLHATQEAKSKLSAAIRLQGLDADALTEKYDRQVSAIERLTGADGDAMLSGLAMMQGFVGQQEISEELTKSILDLSTGMNMDLKSAFDLVGKTIGTNTNALSRYGIEVDANATKQEKIAAIIEQVNGRFRGQAEASAQGLGQIKLLSVGFADFQKALATQFAPIIEQVLSNLKFFFFTLADNQPIVEVVSKLIIMGTALSALVLGISTAGLAYVKFTAIMGAAQIAMTQMTVATRLLVGATGIGLLVLALAAVFADWSTLWPKMKSIFIGFVTGVSELLHGLGKLMIGAFEFDLDGIKQGLAQIKNSVAEGLRATVEETKAQKRELAAEEKAAQDKQIAEQRKFAARMQAEQEASEQRSLALKRATQELAILEAQGATAALIALKREETELLKKIEDDKFAGIRAQLAAHLAEVRILQENQRTQDMEAERILKENILLQNEEFQALTQEQKDLFLAQNQEKLMTEVQTEHSIRQQAALKKVQDQIKEHNIFLENQQKFGTAYAGIFKAMNSEIYKGSRTAFGDLAELQQSENSKLKAIGKAAAIANIMMKTAESAMNIYSGFSTIPIIGQALGIAGAAAAVTFGAEQIRRVTAANEGGIIPGAGPDRDSTLSFLTPGELVVPRKNFDEVVNAVAMGRGLSGGAPGSSSSSGATEIVLSLRDDLIDFIEAHLVERRALNLSVQGV